MSDLRKKINALRERIARGVQAARLDEKKKQLIGLQHQMSQPDFWQDASAAKEAGQKASGLESEIEEWEKIKREADDLLAVVKMDEEDAGADLSSEAQNKLIALEENFKKLEFNLLFSGKYDESDCAIAIYSGAGGTDAQDWAETLLRMYLRFCERRGWKTEIVSLSPGNEAGIKSVMFQVNGRWSYGYLKGEKGVHRLVRISPFDAEKMRHTSFAMVEALPLLPEKSAIEIKPEELRVDTFRAAGHGGQGVNTTDSAVRVTHLATGIIVTCQNERSQMQNKETAFKILRAKLQQYYEAEQDEERQRLRGEFTEAAWGNQIRSYVIHPYKMVKDHRTDYETSDVESVLDGDIADFIEAYLRENAEKSFKL